MLSSESLQFSLTFTHKSRNTFFDVIFSMCALAKVAAFLRVSPFLPIIIFSIEMMVSMFLMFGHMMNQLSGVIKF